MSDINQTIEPRGVLDYAVDDTLTIRGRAADAAATGAELSTKASNNDLAGEAASREAFERRVDAKFTELLGTEAEGEGEATKGTLDTKIEAEAKARDEAIAAAIERLLMEKLYPVGGQPYISLDPTDPAEVLGFGVWERLKGRVIVGAYDEDDEQMLAAGFGKAGQEFGQTAYMHTHGDGYTGETSLDLGQMPAHDHNERAIRGWFMLADAVDIRVAKSTTTPKVSAGTGIPLADGSALASDVLDFVRTASKSSRVYYHSATDYKKNTTAADTVVIDATHTHDTQGEGKGHRHGIAQATVSALQPAKAYYMWERVE